MFSKTYQAVFLGSNGFVVRGLWGDFGEFLAVKLACFKVVWGADRIKCKESGRIRMIASAINNAVNRVRKFNIGDGITAFREDMSFNLYLAIPCISIS
ncbi:MAG: hypothetical protein EAZ70_01165 [Runella slithyformis]|nr:MAG: hypothetical protein EAZ70_01165 [Runella slithyformis]TAF48544.1 MAG: hypothetical protein EAZ63_04550 [Runella slithyformis]TAF83342.1 MAG: hypothetical protein EAZ50_01605 [Runella slithyformis]